MIVKERLNNDRVAEFLGMCKSEMNRRISERVLPIALVTGSEKRHFYRIYRYLLEEFLGRRLSNEELEYLI